MASTLVLGQQGWRESIGDRSKLETAATSEMDDCLHNYLANTKVRTIENLSCPKWKKNLSNILERPSLSIAKKSLSCRPGMGSWPVADRRPCGFIFFSFSFTFFYHVHVYIYIHMYVYISIYIMHCVLYGCYVDHHLYMDGVGWGGVEQQRHLHYVLYGLCTLRMLRCHHFSTLRMLRCHHFCTLQMLHCHHLKSLKNCCDKKIMQQLC